MRLSEEEIVVAWTQLLPLKAPRADGFPSEFYKKYWPSIQETFVKTCLHILKEKGDIAALNKADIVLVLKTKNLTKVIEFP